MIYLARFALKGLSQAALVAASLAILGLVFPPAAWISGAAIAVFTLVYGAQRGVMVMMIASIGAAIFAYLIFGAPIVALVFALIAWLPVWVVAVVLKQTVSLATTMQMLTVVSLLGVVVLYGLFPGFAELWRPQFDQVITQLAASSDQLQLAELRAIQETVLGLLPGIFVSSLMLTTLLSLFLARWWQAVLYNPGGFGKEYRSLDLGRTVGYFTAGLALAALLMASQVSYALILLMSTLYILQGTAVMHALSNRFQLNAVWLFLVYVLMLFIPHLVLVLAVTGFADTWLRLRQRFTAD